MKKTAFECYSKIIIQDNPKARKYVKNSSIEPTFDENIFFGSLNFKPHQM